MLQVVRTTKISLARAVNNKTKEARITTKAIIKVVSKKTLRKSKQNSNK